MTSRQSVEKLARDIGATVLFVKARCDVNTISVTAPVGKFWNYNQNTTIIVSQSSKIFVRLLWMDMYKLMKQGLND